MLAMRSEVAGRYTALLAGVDGVEPPLADDEDHKRSWFVYVVKLPREVDRETVLETLKAQGIEAGHYVPAVHLQPYMREQYGFAEGVCPVAEDACDRSLALPFFPQLEAADQELVVDALRDAVAA
jgi:perosamine synthetase